MSLPRESSSNDAWRSREEILNRFEIAWRETGETLIERFLPAEESASRDELLCELIKIDLEYRWDGGQKTTIENYFTRFPQLLNSDATVLDLIREEVSVRCFHGCPPTAAELANRFSDRNLDWAALCRSTPQGSISRRDTPPVASISSTLIPAGGPKSDAASRRRDAPGRLGRFEIQEVIGKGGFATVYRAWDPELQRDTAIKVPDAPLIIDDSIKTRLLREATSAARLRHPAIVAIHEVSKDENCPFIVYEFIPGPTLAQVMDQTTPSPQQAAQWTARIAEALEYAHANGIVHRDVKPANIMMGGDGQPLLADFGLAMQTEAACTLTQEGDVLGTPAYMSPEQAGGRGHAADARTDVYALGVVLYELLCGRLPFQGTGASVLHRVIHEEPIAPRNVCPQVPIDLETICLRAMAKEPVRRYPTAGAMALDLQRYLDHRPILARRLGMAGRFALWCRRQPALAGTIAAAVLGIAIVGAVSFAQVIRERDHFRQERDRAQANLYRALAGETRALMKARDSSWWWKAMANLEAAARLDTAPRDVAELRELAIECMGTKYPCMRLQAELPGPSGRTNSVALNAEATLAAAAQGDVVRIWHLPDGELQAVLTGHTKVVTRVAFDPLGRWLASASLDGALRLWDLHKAPFTQHAPLSESTAHETVGSAQVISLGAGAIYSLAFAADGAWVAAGCADGTVRLISMDAGSGTATVTQTLKRHKSPVTCLTASPEGRLLASASTDRVTCVWAPPSADPQAVIGARSTPNCLAFAYAGAVIAWSDDESFGFEIKSVRGNGGDAFTQLHTDAVTQVIFDASNNVLTASIDGSIRLWSRYLSRIQELALARGEMRGIIAMDWSKDRRWIVAGCDDGRVWLWELAEPAVRTLVEENSQFCSFLGGGRTLIKAFSTWNLSELSRPRREEFSPPAITAMASHPSSSRLVHGDARGDLRIWVESRGAVDHLAHEHNERITGLASSPDGRRFASVSTDGQALVWDWDRQCKLHDVMPGLGILSGVGWTQNSKRVVLLGSYGALLWEPGTPQSSCKRLENVLGCEALACGRGRIALGARDGSIRLFDETTGKVLHVLEGHTGIVAALAFSPDGSQLASAAEDKSLRLWDCASGREVAVAKAEIGATPWIAFQPDGTHLATGSRPYNTTSVWELPGLTVSVSFRDRNHEGGCFLPDGARLALGEKTGAVSVFPMKDLPKKIRTIDQPGPGVAPGVTWLVLSKSLVQGGHLGDVWGVATSPDGRWIATSSHDGTVKLWDAHTHQLGRTLSAHGPLCWCVAFSADSKYVATGAGDVLVWEVDTGKEIRRFRGHKYMVTGVAFHPRHGWLASTSFDGSVRLWDVAGGRALGKLRQSNLATNTLAFNQDGALLAVGGADRRIRVWNCGDWAQEWLQRGSDRTKVDPLAVEPDHELVNEAGPVRSVAFDQQGQYLASGSEQGAITLWGAGTLERIVTLRGGTGQIRGLSFSDDGALLAGSAYASPTIVWDMKSLRARLRSMNLDW